MFQQAEERINAATHGIGTLFSVLAGAVLIHHVVLHRDLAQIASCSIFALALVGVYTASTLSHTFSGPPLGHLLRRLDQGLIYLLIVATYTPLSVAYLNGAWWWTFLGVLWTVAAAGFVSKVVFGHRVEAATIWGYVLLGWLPILAAPALIEVASARALWWILLGGLCYTFGTVFLLLDKRLPHFHAAWHLCVLLGSGFHFCAIHLVVTSA